MTTRTLNRNQKAEYVRGSVNHNRPFVYELQITERKGATVSYFTIEGEEAATSKEAIQSAWKNAKAHVAEFGEVKISDSEYSATSND